MSLTTHSGITLRMLWACCAADPLSPLSATQRAAIWDSLHDHAWSPDLAALPQTAAAVERWYAGLQGAKKSVRVLTSHAT